MTRTATDRAAFIAAIIDEPNDNLKREIYADWLEGDGPGDCSPAEPARGELIRVQCSPCSCDTASISKLCARCDRELELLMRYRYHFAPPGILRVTSARSSGLLTMTPFRYRRGFVEHVMCSVPDLFRYGTQILEETPIHTIDLYDAGAFLSITKGPAHVNSLGKVTAPGTWYLDVTMPTLAGWRNRAFATRAELVAALPVFLGDIPGLDLARITGTIPGDFSVGQLVRYDNARGQWFIATQDAHGVIASRDENHGTVMIQTRGPIAGFSGTPPYVTSPVTALAGFVPDLTFQLAYRNAPLVGPPPPIVSSWSESREEPHREFDDGELVTELDPGPQFRSRPIYTATVVDPDKPAL